MVPAAKVTWDAATQRLSVIATSRDQQRVAEVLLKFSKEHLQQPNPIGCLSAGERIADAIAKLFWLPHPVSSAKSKLVEDQRPAN